MKINKSKIRPLLVVAVIALGGGLAMWYVASRGNASAPAEAASRPDAAASAAGAKAALSVRVVTPSRAEWAQTLAANGSIAAWEEAVIGAETAGLRLTEVQVNVGDRVRRGQLLARLSSDTVQAALGQTRAALAEAQATLAEARANAERARQLQTSGAISEQQINQYLTAEQTARARLEAQRAALRAEELRLSQTRIVAPDDGVISARQAAVGSIAQPGQELFRLIRRGRLEWRAEVTEAELARLRPGLAATLLMPDGTGVKGSVRMVAPTIDPQTRYGLVYVDLPADPRVRAGMFARGEFEFGRSTALSLPQSAVLLRDGFQYVLRVQPDARVALTKVSTGRRTGDRIEVLAGLSPDVRVVASGGAFLSDGDLVRVVGEPTAAAPAAAAASR
ncbi:efflux RND transporter periplasmic adaptor subunit [Aquabacterium sp. A7-Y]|uniref:efflux RND transporter periplasmic adaptor subunit n=1 Tax=Aquabacterium sp. A7-Y TaxID=1349605 RepID=UPI00223E077B|nr:efflux RND transporter periplasmic adaptor subunit [Aquabacterium sp. A7-Y]MCW7541053.1 efflux RND transporter periplasmic adaptor subunit [Aquabacterium sp. A7-Y]